MALAYGNEPVANKTEIKRTETNRLCTIEATCGIEGIRTPQTAEPGFIGLEEDAPIKMKKVSGNASPTSSTSSSLSSSSNHGTSRSDVQFLAHLKALTAANPEKMELECKKIEIESRRLTIMEKSGADMKEFIQQTLNNQQALMLALLAKVGVPPPSVATTDLVSHSMINGVPDTTSVRSTVVTQPTSSTTGV